MSIYQSLASSKHFFRDTSKVDRIRSHPVYYVDNGYNHVFSPNAKQLAYKYHLTTYNEKARWEYIHAGYVLGKYTMLDGLYQMQAGEHLNGGIKPYYEYKPTGIKTETTANLNSVLNDIFNETIKCAAGNLIAIPVSGGLDSRLVLCKLHELGYRDIIAFSYGRKGNDEAKTARETCEALGVSWNFIETNHQSTRQYYTSPEGRAFIKSVFDFATCPNIQDVEVVSRLRLPKDTIFINGQAGDFITGGHIPDGDYTEYIRRKHFGLWPSNEIHEVLIDNWMDYETWEWRERQSKYVVGGQRAYEHYGYRWDLPLWYQAFMDFWEPVKLEQKQGQTLYKDFLKEWNYNGVFSKTRDIRRYATWVRFLAAVLFPFKNTVYAYGKYWGYYGNQYAPFGLRNFIANGKARNAVSFWVKDA